MLTYINSETKRIRAPSLKNGLSCVSEAISDVRPTVLSDVPFPLDPLSAVELEAATGAVKRHAASALSAGTPLRFNIVTLQVLLQSVPSLTARDFSRIRGSLYPYCIVNLRFRVNRIVSFK